MHAWSSVFLLKKLGGLSHLIVEKQVDMSHGADLDAERDDATDP